MLINIAIEVIITIITIIIIIIIIIIITSLTAPQVERNLTWMPSEEYLYDNCREVTKCDDTTKYNGSVLITDKAGILGLQT